MNCRVLMCLLVVASAVLVGAKEVKRDANQQQQQKDNMEHLFPLLFLMNGTPAVCGPAVWLVGALSLAAVWLVHGSALNKK